MRTIVFGAVGLTALSASSFGQIAASLTLTDGTDSGGLPFNTTQFVLTNLSASGIEITGMSLTVGDLNYVFDQIYLSSEVFVGVPGATATLVTGDRSQDGANTDLFAYAFTGFGSAGSFTGQFDIDKRNGDFVADARSVLFNNGDAANTVWTVSFSNGQSASLTLPDGPLADTSYTFTVPSPGAAALLAAGGLLVIRRRR